MWNNHGVFKIKLHCSCLALKTFSLPSFLGDKSEWRFTVLSKRVNSPEEYSFFSFAWKRASVWYSEVQIRDIFRSLPKECPKNGKLMRSLRMIFFTVTTVLTFCREITVSKAYFLLTFKPTSKWCAFRFIHSDLLYILLWKSLDKKKVILKALYKTQVCYLLLGDIWFSCHNFPFLSLSEQYTSTLNDATSIKKLSFEGSKVSFHSCI